MNNIITSIVGYESIKGLLKDELHFCFDAVIEFRYSRPINESGGRISIFSLILADSLFDPIKDGIQIDCREVEGRIFTTYQIPSLDISADDSSWESFRYRLFDYEEGRIDIRATHIQLSRIPNYQLFKMISCS